MATIPPAIIFINNDLTDNVKSVLIKQLYIFESMTGEEFDARVLAEPEYPNIVRLNGLRIMVIRDFSDKTGFDVADIVIFVKAGLAYIETSNADPPGLTLPVANLYIHELLRAVGKIT